ncbi:hypothetical protein ABK040_013678 [Willaertia magna]
MSKLLLVAIGIAAVVGASGGFKKLFSPRNVQNAAKHLRETKEIFVNELSKKDVTTEPISNNSNVPKSNPNLDFTKQPPSTSDVNVNNQTPTNTQNTEQEKKQQ